MKYKILDPDLSGNEEKYLLETIRTGWISSQGSFVKRFEDNFAGYNGSRYAVAVCNGTVALHLALLAGGIGPKDEVIVPSLTFAATANSVIHAGAVPVFADVEPDCWGISPESVKRLISKKTKAIIPVHLYGFPAEMDELRQIAKKNSLLIIEDAAEAHGTLYKNKRAGSIGDLGCFSFYGNKIITTGEGGIVLTNNKIFYKKMLILKDHGMSTKRKYWHDLVGYNYRMTNMQASIGVGQLEHIDQIIQKKKQIHSWYIDLLGKHRGIMMRYQVSRGSMDPSCWLFAVLLDKMHERGKLLRRLIEDGVDCRPVFYPLHTMPPYRQYRKDGRMRETETIGRLGICLPSSTWLEKVNVEDIICKLEKALNHCK
jgi:perosamine synthetase